MAAPKQQFAYCSNGTTALLLRLFARMRRMASVNRADVSKMVARNTIIVQFFLLTLLLPLQAAAEEKTPQPAQGPSEADNRLSTIPVTSKTKAGSIYRTAAGPAELELAAATPAPTPMQSGNKANEDIRTRAAATHTAVTADALVKIASSGEPLDTKADTWECVEDKSSNLTWEVKKNDGGIRDKDYLYSWLSNSNGENRGVVDGGRCEGRVKCDTYSYVRAMNEQKLCGYTDWRLPTREEMETLVYFNTTATDVAINKTYFPEAVPSWYWTATENPQREDVAWYVLFRNGIALNDLKERPKHIRLVRGNQTR